MGAKIYVQNLLTTSLTSGKGCPIQSIFSWLGQVIFKKKESIKMAAIEIYTDTKILLLVQYECWSMPSAPLAPHFYVRSRGVKSRLRDDMSTPQCYFIRSAAFVFRQLLT